MQNALKSLHAQLVSGHLIAARFDAFIFNVFIFYQY